MTTTTKQTRPAQDGKHPVIGWHHGPGRRILANNEQLDGLPVVRVGPRCHVVHRLATDEERRLLGLTDADAAIIEVDRGDDKERQLRRQVPARELYPAGRVTLVMTSNPNEPSPITPFVLHEQQRETWAGPQWNLPVPTFCQRCDEAMREWDQTGVPRVVCPGCGRRIEAHFFGLTLVTWLYHYLRRRGDLPEVDLGTVAATLGVKLDHFAQHVSNLVVNTKELRLWVTTGGPYLRTDSIVVGLSEIISSLEPSVVDKPRLDRQKLYYRRGD